MKQQSPMLRLWELGAEQHGALLRAILSAVAGVLCGMAPYFAAARILIGLLGESGRCPIISPGVLWP